MSRRHAWVAAGLYLVVIVAGMFAEIGVRQGLVVSGDAAETAKRLLASEGLYRAGVGADVLMTAFDVVLTAILYLILRGYGRTVALTATALRLVANAMLAVKTVLALAPLVMLKSAPLLAAFGRPGAEALALLSLRLHDSLYGVVMVFAGLNLGAMAAPVLRAPGRTSRIAGVLLAVGCLCDLAVHGAAILSPALSAALPDALSVVPLLAEIAFIAWLLLVAGRGRGRRTGAAG